MKSDLFILFIYLFIYSFVYLFMYLFIYLFIRTLESRLSFYIV